MLAQCLRALPITVTISGTPHTIPPLSALEWVPAIAEDYVTGVVPGLLEPGDRDALLHAMAVGRVDVDDLRTASRAAITEASGRPWWEAVRLVGAGDDTSGAVVGQLLLAGVDPGRVTLAGWCAAVYALATRGADAKARMKFDAPLQMPPAGVDVDDGQWDTVQW